MAIKNPGQNKKATLDQVAAAVAARVADLKLTYVYEGVSLVTMGRAVGALGARIPLDVDRRFIAGVAAGKRAHGHDTGAELAHLSGLDLRDGVEGTFLRFAVGVVADDEAAVDEAVKQAIGLVRSSPATRPNVSDPGQIFASQLALFDRLDAVAQIVAAYGLPLLPMAQAHRLAALVRAGSALTDADLEAPTDVVWGQIPEALRDGFLDLLASRGKGLNDVLRKARIERELRRDAPRLEVLQATRVDAAALYLLSRGEVERARALIEAAPPGHVERAAARLLLLDDGVDSNLLPRALATAVRFAGPRRRELDAFLEALSARFALPIEQVAVAAARAGLVDEPIAAAAAFAAARERWLPNGLLMEVFEKTLVPAAIDAGQLVEAARAAAKSKHHKAQLLTDIGVAFAQRGDLGGVVEVLGALPKKIFVDELTGFVEAIAGALPEGADTGTR